jgi:hypothetical protein
MSEFLLFVEENGFVMTVNLEDDLSFEQHDAIPMSDSFL